MKGKLLVISGPSAAVGKDTILKMFLAEQPSWHQPPSLTTRQPREGEVPGKDMVFVSKDEFVRRDKNGEFLETDHHAENWYGTLLEPVQRLLDRGENVFLSLVRRINI